MGQPLQTSTEENPLDRLAETLAPEMKMVNEIIVKQMDSPVALIPQLAGYLVAAGGKRIRPLLTLACTHLFDAEIERAYGLSAAVEFIHTATLLHDDVVDESAERRGQASANEIFGNQASVLVGDFLFSRAFQLMVADGSLEILRILSDASAIIAQGEVMQLATTNNLETSMDDYLEVVKAKTAALFAAACEVGPVLANTDPQKAKALAEYGLNLGIAFQIADDILDYTAAQESLGKAIGDDFKEGKMTAPVILALAKANAEEKDFWLRTLRDMKQNEDDFQNALKIMKTHNSFTEATELSRDYAGRAQDCLLELNTQHNMRTLLEDLANYTVERLR